MVDKSSLKLLNLRYTRISRIDRNSRTRVTREPAQARDTLARLGGAYRSAQRDAVSDRLAEMLRRYAMALEGWMPLAMAPHSMADRASMAPIRAIADGRGADARQRRDPRAGAPRTSGARSPRSLNIFTAGGQSWTRAAGFRLVNMMSC